MADTPDPSRAAARVVLVCGPSGVGKSSLVRRLGLPALALDDYYRDGDGGHDGDGHDGDGHDGGHDAAAPALPHRYGIVDWDDPASWDADAAMAGLRALCGSGRADVPVYDIPTSRRTGTARLDLGGAPLVVAEGIFAAQLVPRCREEGLLADAICVSLPRWRTFGRRLLRDLAEARKPPPTLLRRGLALAGAEPALVAQWRELGCRVLSPAQAEAAVRSLVARA